MSPEVWASAVVSAVTGVCGVWAARAARRTPRQELRDDFTAIRDSLTERIDDLKTEVDKQRTRIGDQDAAISYLARRVRGLVSYIRKTGMEPPPAEPMPERVQAYIQHIDV